MDTYEVDTTGLAMLLDMLLKSGNEIDSTLTLRRSCGEVNPAKTIARIKKMIATRTIWVECSRAPQWTANAEAARRCRRSTRN
jgi:succinate dehydrogenase/fumarate reductase-like Fe-S protein